MRRKKSDFNKYKTNKIYKSTYKIWTQNHSLFQGNSYTIYDFFLDSK